MREGEEGRGEMNRIFSLFEWEKFRTKIWSRLLQYDLVFYLHDFAPYIDEITEFIDRIELIRDLFFAVTPWTRNK